MKRILSVILLAAVTTGLSFGKEYKLSSPDGKIIVTINVGTDVKWSVTYDGKEVITSVKAGMILENNKVPGAYETVRKSVSGKINQVLEPVVPNKRSKIPDECNTLLITFKSGLAINFRAYNDGIAYRFETALKDEITVKDEITDLQFPKGTISWYLLEDSYLSPKSTTYEKSYIDFLLDTISAKHLATIPSLFKANGINVLITEANVDDYPGMWIKGAGSDRISGVHPKYPDKEVLKNGLLVVASEKDYIAKTKGTRSFPWRAFVIAANDGQLVESDLIFKLADPNKLADTKWIKPGKVAWDWWNALNIYGVDFKSGVNNDTYKYYIDFASKNGIQYVILDVGWYKRGSTLLESVPEINVPELCKYAENKNVGIILWVVSKTFWDNIDKACDLYEKWGVKGVKVDYEERDDQKEVIFYREAAQKTAEHHLLIDFHGANKPDGLGRTYPNALTREGVMGMEHSKWSKNVTPHHDLMLPFTRMVAGPMDYTPGAMVNMEKDNFTPIRTRPSSQGTRVHQMAMYVVYESPLQMLSDSPSNYMKEQECTDFIVKVPVVWDDLKVLNAKVGEYLLLARRSGSTWYVGAMTDWTDREMEVDLSFLTAGNYVMESFQDGINAGTFAQDYKHSKTNVKAGDKVKIKLGPGGGWVASISAY